jgi:PAS domain S-box-containing protein
MSSEHHEPERLSGPSPKAFNRVESVRADQSAAFFSAVVEHSPDCIKILDRDGKITWISPRGVEMLEADSPGQVEGMEWADLWPLEEDRETARRALDTAKVGGVGRFEASCPTMGGVEKWWNVAVVSLPVEAEAGIRLLSIWRDVTERRIIEERLRESEERFRNMADHAPVMIWIAGADGLCSYLSKSWYEFTGMPPSPDKIADWRAAVHPVDLPAVEAQLREAHRRRSGRPVEYRARRHDGQYRWILDSAVQRQDGNGRFAGYVGSMVDITDRRTAEVAVRQSEELFRTLANSIPQLAWMARPDGRIFWFNQRWYDYIGQARGMSAADDWWRYHGEPGSEAVRHAFEQALGGGEPFREAFPLIRHDGEALWHLCQMLPIRDDEGRLRLWFGTHTDITEEREAHRRKDKFLATLAHELRNPLAPILTGLEVIRSSLSHPEVISKVTDMMERQTGQMVHLIDDLLDMARINAGKIELRKSRGELDDILRGAVEASRPLIDEHGHRFEMESRAAGIEVEADSHRIAQVVSNLLSNAAKYTPAGGLIRLVSGVDPEGRPWFSVSDNGHGIEAAQHEKIFDLFEQVDHGRQDGLGIGLTLVKTLVDLHGGSIELKSGGLGKGCEFIIRLPSCPCRPTPAGESLWPVVEAAHGGSWQKVMVVEDSRNTADILAMFFEMEGRDVVVAYDGEEAVRKAAESLPELILMDLGMPRMDGFEAARRIRSLPGSGAVTLVALSGWGQPQDKEKSRQAGFDEHLVKPVSPTDLRELLQRLDAARGNGC